MKCVSYLSIAVIIPQPEKLRELSLFGLWFQRIKVHVVWTAWRQVGNVAGVPGN